MKHAKGKNGLIIGLTMVLIAGTAILHAAVIDVGMGDTFSYSWEPSTGSDSNMEADVEIVYYTEPTQVYLTPRRQSVDATVEWHIQTTPDSNKVFDDDVTLAYRSTLFDGGYIKSYWSTGQSIWNQIKVDTWGGNVIDSEYTPGGLGALNLSDFGYTGGSTDLYFKFVLQSYTAATTKIQFSRDGTGDSRGVLSFDGSLATVPEPATLILFGSMGLVPFMRRKR